MTRITPHSATSSAQGRIIHVLEYIHSHLDQPLSVDDIARHSCWSRWQLQRVFQSQLGISVAQYVRELKLSEAAEQMLNTSERIIDIALNVGFQSEISFSRAFRNMFGVSPRPYRLAGQRSGLRKPIAALQSLSAPSDNDIAFIDVSVDSREAFTVHGLSASIRGLFADKPNFATEVPRLWERLQADQAIPLSNTLGITAVPPGSTPDASLVYWATANISPGSTTETLSAVTIPAQTYAVVRHQGPISQLPDTLMWFILNWLPDSGYRGVNGYELEVYPPGYDSTDKRAEMEYWLPIESNRTE